MAELLEILVQHPVLMMVFAGLFGALFGSFLNAAIYRLPRNISMLKVTRSFCPSCNHNLAWYDNLPILSYLALGGKCHYCRKPIGIRYLVIELLTVLMVLLVAWHCLLLNPLQLGLLGFLQLGIFGCGLILLIATDLESFLIPEEASLVPLVASLGLAYFVPGSHLLADIWVPYDVHTMPIYPGGLNALIDAVQGAVLAAGVTYGVGGIGTWVKREDAMGGGDVLLMAAIGATVGWKLGVLTLFLASFAGIAMYIAQSIYLRMVKRAAEPIRFAIPDENAAPEPWYARVLNQFNALWTGVAMILVNGTLLVVHHPAANRAIDEGIGIPLGLSLGIGLGAFFVLYYFVRKQHMAKGTWVQPVIETAADGSQTEVLDQATPRIAFGPALAIAGFFQAIWGPWFLRIIETRLVGVPPEMLTKMLHAPFLK